MTKSRWTCYRMLSFQVAYVRYRGIKGCDLTPRPRRCCSMRRASGMLRCGGSISLKATVRRRRSVIKLIARWPGPQVQNKICSIMIFQALNS